MDEVFALALRNLDGGAFIGLVALLATAMWRGWLVPRPTVVQLLEAREVVIAAQSERLAESLEREREWRAAWMTSEERGRVRDAQTGDLLEMARTTDALVRALPRVLREGETR